MCFRAWVCIDMPSSLSKSSHQFLLIAQSLFPERESFFFYSKFPCIHATSSFSLLSDRTWKFRHFPGRKFEENLFNLSITFSTFARAMEYKFSSLFSAIKCKISVLKEHSAPTSSQKRRKFILFGPAIAMKDKRKNIFHYSPHLSKWNDAKLRALRQAKLTTASMKHSESIILHL